MGEEEEFPPPKKKVQKILLTAPCQFSFLLYAVQSFNITKICVYAGGKHWKNICYTGKCIAVST